MVHSLYEVVYSGMRSYVFFVAVRVISIDETCESLPCSLVTCSVPMVISVTFAFLINRCRTISAVSTAVLIDLPRAFIITVFELAPLNWVTTAMT